MRALLRRLAACTVVVIAALGVAPTSVRADPVVDAEGQATQVAARMAALDAKLTVLSGRVANAEHDLEVVHRQAAEARAELAVAQGILDRHRVELSDLAVQIYMGGGASETGVLGDLDGTAAQAPVKDGFVQTVSQKRTDIVSAAASAERDVSRRVDALARVEAQATHTARRLADEQAATTKALAEQAALQKKVSAHLAVLIAQQSTSDARTPAAARATLKAARLTQLPAAPNPAATLAVATALSAVGDPYVWGAAGPNRFDCSGLVLWSWGKAGVSLAHWTGFQIHQGWPIDMKDLLPGDLIFMWRPGAKSGPPDHVAMYIGNHLIVQAPHAGGYVEVSSMGWWPGARRTAVRLGAPTAGR
jgi:cell wall-associated NlpC family hydrolase